MTPYERMRSETLLDEILEDIRWRKQATPEEIVRADALMAYWYEQRDEAEEFKERITALVDRQFKS